MKRVEGPARGGAVLVCVMACLGVSSVLVALSVQSALRGRRESRLQLQLRQTELLCEAGVRRAASRLRVSADYPGEQWRPELGMENYHDAFVDIQVAATQVASDQVSNVSANFASTNPTARKVTVIAKLDSFADHDGPMQRTRSFIVQTPTSSSSLENKQ